MLYGKERPRAGLITGNQGLSPEMGLRRLLFFIELRVTLSFDLFVIRLVSQQVTRAM